MNIKIIISFRIILLAFIFTLLIIPDIFAQEVIDTFAIKKKLDFILERDQKTRTHGDSVEFMAYIDSCNLVEVTGLIDKYGWPGKHFVGGSGNLAIFLVIQHADLAIQEKYFPLLEKSVAEEESSPSHLALMKDRILMRQGKKQIYGSQVVFNKETGAQEFYQIEDEVNVDIRREKVGLEPLKNYAKYFGINYEYPKKK